MAAKPSSLPPFEEVVPRALDSSPPLPVHPARPTREVVTLDEACRMLGIHRRTFERRWEDGTLPQAGIKQANRLTRRRLFDRASIERAMWRPKVSA